MPPGDVAQPVADLNLIPSALIDTVDVLTGGAASIYGSDAIAGVVNFKMKHNFEGVQIDAQYNFAEHDNDNALGQQIARAAHHPNVPTGSTIQGRTEHVTITFGSNTADGKGNLEGYLGYINQEPVRQSVYDYAYCAVTGKFAYVNNIYTMTGHACGGSSNSAYGKFSGKFYGALNGTDWVSSNTLNPTGQTLSNNLGGTNFVTYSSPPGGNAVNRTWNYAPFQYFQRQDTRYQGGYFARYDINEHVTAYSDFLFEQDSSTSQLAASGLFSNNGAINRINCDDPYATAQQQQAMCGPNAGNPNVLSAPFTIGYRMQNRTRDTELTHSSYKMDLGLKGSIDDVWSYDVYAQFARAENKQLSTGDVSKRNIAAALNAIPDGHGGAVCAGGQPNCVPLNIFQPLSAGITQAQFNYIEQDSITGGYVTEQVVSGNVVGKLGKYGIQSPWAHEGVGLAIGAEYRRDYLKTEPDGPSIDGDNSGSQVGGVAKTQGAISDKDVYAELSVPVISDRFLAKDVTLDLSYRRSDYVPAGTSGTYKFGGDWVVTPDVRFRGSFARTERAPNVLELFTPPQITNNQFADPCSGSHPIYSATQCYRTGNLAALGVTQAQFIQNIYGQISACPAGQCNGLTGGSPSLKPEIADTTTLGMVFTPHFFRGFYASIDYWDIDLKGAIAGLPFNAVMNACYQNNIAFYCNGIFRDPVNGTLTGVNGYVTSINQNLASIHKRGWDIQWNYRFHLKDTGILPDWGTVDTDFVGTYLAFDTTTLPVEGQYNCAGLFGVTCNQSDPRWRHKFRATWATPWKVDFSVQWRYIAQVKADVNSSNPILNGLNGAGALTSIDAIIPAYSYIDLAAVWRIRGNLSLRAGVNNVFDKDPPVIDTNVFPLTNAAGNTYPNVYDPLGRTIFVNLTAKF
jgi:outer membrane receptor protein involved in Fe transport